MKGIGFKFNDKHSYNDFGLILDSKEILDPAKVKIKVSVPYMNGSYDFSTIGSGGDPVFGERQIQVILGFPTGSKEELHSMYTLVLEWLKDTGRQKLIFDDIFNWYFIAEVEAVSKFEEMYRMGKLTVSFAAQPFKYNVDMFGDDIWDTFNFLTDYTQYDNTFDIDAFEKDVLLDIYNNGRSICPIINSSVDGMKLIFNGVQYDMVQGDNKFWNLKLGNGKNTLKFSGANGTIKIIFRSEIL